MMSSKKTRGFNLYQMLQVIRLAAGSNQEVPTFILQLYVAWMKSNLLTLGDRSSKMPPEDIQSYHNGFKKQYEDAWKMVEKAFEEFKNNESAKK